MKIHPLCNVIIEFSCHGCKWLRVRSEFWLAVGVNSSRTSGVGSRFSPTELAGSEQLNRDKFVCVWVFALTEYAIFMCKKIPSLSVQAHHYSLSDQRNKPSAGCIDLYLTDTIRGVLIISSKSITQNVYSFLVICIKMVIAFTPVKVNNHIWQSRMISRQYIFNCCYHVLIKLIYYVTFSNWQFDLVFIVCLLLLLCFCPVSKLKRIPVSLGMLRWASYKISSSKLRWQIYKLTDLIIALGLIELQVVSHAPTLIFKIPWFESQ